ncbi:MAG: hypothetical protein WCO10_03610 [bacterium]
MIVQQFQTWGEVLSASFKGVWLGVASFIPSFLAAIIIFAIGWAVAYLLGKLVAQVIKSIKLDLALRGAGFEKIVNRAGFNLDSGAFLGALVKWFFIIVFLMASLEVLGLTQVNQFLQGVVLSYLPQVIVAVFMFLVAVVIAEAMQKLVVASAKAANISSANFLGSVTKWAIWIFALLTVMLQLGIAAAFIQTLFTGLIVAVSLALGLAFGLGGKDVAARYLDKVRDEISSKR